MTQTLKYSRPRRTLRQSLDTKERILQDHASDLARYLDDDTIEGCNALTDDGALVIFSPGNDALSAQSELRLYKVLKRAVMDFVPQMLDQWFNPSELAKALPPYMFDALLAMAEDRFDCMLKAGVVTLEQCKDFPFPSAYGKEKNGTWHF